MERWESFAALLILTVTSGVLAQDVRAKAEAEGKLMMTGLACLLCSAFPA